MHQSITALRFQLPSCLQGCTSLLFLSLGSISCSLAVNLVGECGVRNGSHCFTGHVVFARAELLTKG